MFDKRMTPNYHPLPPPKIGGDKKMKFKSPPILGGGRGW
ncbi:MAG: hypothetical protein HW421_1720 [Ignavibacteria bacterium]|nr:hypothetical protein [Ignavibacteria bacterium]